MIKLMDFMVGPLAVVMRWDVLMWGYGWLELSLGVL